jgi:hypothetical protein
MGYYSQISTQINSQAAAAVFKTMLSTKKCLEKAYPNTGDVRKLCNLFSRVKSDTKKKLDACRKAQRDINTMLEWLHESIFHTEKGPAPPPPVVTVTPDPPDEDYDMIEDLTLDPEPVSVPEHDPCENED